MSAEKRIFTFEEARRTVPALRARTEQALKAIAALETAEGEDAETARGRMERGAAGILGEWARDVAAMGLEVKGPWLVDFDSGAGYWCWKWPEESLDFFHGYDEGFAGRVRIQ